MLIEHLKPKQNVVYWSPTLEKHVYQKIRRVLKTKVILENNVNLNCRKILAIIGE